MKTLHLMVLLLGTAQNSHSLAKETSIVITKYLLKVTGISRGLRPCVQSGAARPGLWQGPRGEIVPPQGLVPKMNRPEVQTRRHRGQGRESWRKGALEGEQPQLCAQQVTDATRGMAATLPCAPQTPQWGCAPPFSMLGSCQSAHLRWSCISGCEG